MIEGIYMDQIQVVKTEAKMVGTILI